MSATNNKTSICAAEYSHKINNIAKQKYMYKSTHDIHLGWNFVLESYFTSTWNSSKSYSIKEFLSKGSRK